MARFVPRGGFPFGVRSFEASQVPVEGATPETVVVAPAGDAQAASGQQVVEVRPVQTAGGAVAAGGVHVPEVAAVQSAGDAVADGGTNVPEVTVVAPSGEATAHAPGTVGANLVFSDDFTTPNAADYDHSSWVPGTFVSDGAGHLSTDHNDYGLTGSDSVVSASPIGVSVDLTQGGRAQFRFNVSTFTGFHVFDIAIGLPDVEWSSTPYYATLTIVDFGGGVNARLHVDDETATGVDVDGSLATLTGWLVLKIDGTDAIGEVWETDPALGGSPTITNTLSGIDPATVGDRALFDSVFTHAGSWVDDFQVYDGPSLGADSATVLTEEGVPATTVIAPSGAATATGGQQTPIVTAVQTAGEAIATGGANAVIPFEAPTVIRGGGVPTHIVTVTAPAGEAVAEGGENRVVTREVDEPGVRVRRPRVRQRGPRTHPHPTTVVNAPPALAYAHAGTNAARTTETVPLDVLHKQDEEFEELLILGLV